MYVDHELLLRNDVTYYLATDGLLDQSGGDHGFALGRERFGEWLLAHCRRPLADQRRELCKALSQYQGSYPQRDDITLLAFRLPSLPPAC